MTRIDARLGALDARLGHRIIEVMDRKGRTRRLPAGPLVDEALRYLGSGLRPRLNQDLVTFFRRVDPRPYEHGELVAALIAYYQEGQDRPTPHGPPHPPDTFGVTDAYLDIGAHST